MQLYHQHFGHLSRRHPHRLTVYAVGHMPYKSIWMDKIFGAFSFSFIMEGSGEYTVNGRTHAVQAPCVLTQRPGEHFRYGPDGTWDETYVIYDVPIGDELRRLGYIREARPWWPTADPGSVLLDLVGLESLANGPGIDDAIDRVDRLCDSLILHSLLDRPGVGHDAKGKAVEAIRAHVESHFLDHHDFDALAKRHGLSTMTFRRAWQRQVGVPPTQHLLRLRLRLACRLLVETDRPVSRIAGETGFTDPLYFSRRFHEMIGTTATIYRARHRLGESE